MPWSAPTFTGGVVWEDYPLTATPLDAENLNVEESAEATYALAVGQSAVDYFEKGRAPVVVKSTPTGPPVPAGGWSCVLADGFHPEWPFSGLFAPNRNNDAGDNGYLADCGGFNQSEVQVFNASQVIPGADGIHLRASNTPQRISPPGSALTGNATLSAQLVPASQGGGTIISLPITALGVADIANTAKVVVIDPTGQHAQIWTLTAAAAANAVTLSVSSQTPDFAYPAGSIVSAVNYTSGCLSSQPVNPVAGEAGFPITGFTFLPAVGISWAFEIVCSLPAGDMPGGDMGWWATSADGTNELDFMEWTDYDQNLSGVWDLVGAWFDHAHGVSAGGEVFSNSTAVLSAQTDGRMHRWTTAILASDSKVHTYLDGVEITGMVYNWISGWDAGATDYMHLLLSHALRNAYSGKGPAFSGSTDVVVRSVAAYQDTPHLGQSCVGGGTALGTVVV